MYDIVISGGEVIDGTRAPRRRADVAISEDKIAAIGDLSQAEAGARIDARGKIVAPGFIDVHNHDDGWMLRGAHLTAKTTQGFTSEVLMADGISYAPVNRHTAPHWLYYLRALNALRLDEYSGWESWEDYMRLLDGAVYQNCSAHLPYANIRALACGFRRIAVDDFQMRSIKHEIRRGMQAGAVGVSTGLDYIVQCFSTTDELADACEAMAEFDGLYVTHVRYKKGLLPALREAVEIGRRAGVKVHISHLKAPSGEEGDEVLAYIDNVARHEVDLSFDVYPYQPGSTMLTYLLPYDVWEDGPLAATGKLADPEIAARLSEGMPSFRLDPDHIRLAWVAGKENAVHQGKSLSQYVAEQGLPIEQVMMNLLMEERLAVLMVLDEGDDRLVEPFLQHDLYMMGSDGIFHEDGAVHPRVYGSAGRLLGPLVRDRKLFSLEDAVHKMTQRCAERFKMPGRGVLTEGAFADVVVFDAATVGDHATFDQPHQTCTGIEQVLVNGVAVIRDGAPVDELPKPLPGRFLRYEQ
ncbi:MAG: D-aminoacylase [Pirellulaceae bacterium]